MNEPVAMNGPGAPTPAEGQGHREALRLHTAHSELWGPRPGRLGWLATVNHSSIGKRFMLTAILFFLLGGILAMLIRAQLAGPETQFLSAAAYNQVFTMHGTVMMFLFAIPLIEGFALYMLPKILGARDLAFPRLSAFGYWCYLFGGLVLLLALLAGVAPDSGWFHYTPLSSRPYSPGINSDIWLIGVTFVEVSAVAAAIEIMVTVLKVRTAGMSLARMPLLAWYIWVTAAMMVVGFPPLILGSILLELERAFGWAFFAPDRGGDPLLWQHLFWMFGHPEVYIIFLPAAGILSTLIPVHSGREMVGHNWIIGALIAQAFISFGLWVHHMFATGIPHLSLAFFSAASLLVVVPTAIQIFAWLATLLKGRPRLTLPMLWILGFFFIFVSGGLTGVMVAIVPLDLQVHDTHFVVAHLHHVLIGGFVFPVIAGIYHWLPQISGRRSDIGLGKLAFWVTFAGFNLTFLVMHLTGLLGMTRRIYTYAPGLGWDLPNLISSVGGFVTAIGFALLLIDIVVQWRFAPHTQRDPWQARTLEWAMPTPAPAYNFASQPQVSSRSPLTDQPDLPTALAAGQGLLAEPRHGWRETLGVDPVSGTPDQTILLPGPTLVPLAAAMAAGAFFLGFLFKIWPLSGLGAIGVAACAWAWMWNSGLRADPVPLPAGQGVLLMPHPAAPDSPARWAMRFWLVVDAAFLSSLLFGALFLRLIAPGWPPPDPSLAAPVPASVAAVMLLLGAGFAHRAAAANRRDRSPISAQAVASGAGTAAFAAFLWIAVHAPSPTAHAHGAVQVALAGFAALHCAIAALAAAYGAARARAGYVSALRRVDVENPATLWRFTAVAGLVVLLLLVLPTWVR